MNRAMRRRREKEANGNVVSIVELVEQRNKAISYALELYSTCLVKVLRDDFGFGEKRIRRVLDNTNTTLNDIGDNLVSLKDLQEMIYEETNIRM